MRAALSLLLVAGSGCATFVGVEDPQQHLPRLDGSYLVSIERVRADNVTRDVIRMRGTGTLDPDTRTLDLSVGILGLTGNTALSETTINDIAFPDDNDEVEYAINLSIPEQAINANPQPVQADFTINTPVRVIAEADFGFCAKRIDGEREVTMGSVLVSDFAALPAADFDCDDPLRP